MPKAKRRFLLVSIASASFLILTSTGSFAGNVDTYGIGAKAVALGGAYAAYADGPFAAYYNPAGLTQVKNLEISVGTEFIDPHLKLSDFKAKDWEGREVQPYGVTIKDTSPTLNVPCFGAAMPFPSNKRIVFGLAAYVPYGLHIKWDNSPADDPGAYNSFESYYMRMVVTPTIAYKINDKLSVGFGVSLGESKTGSQRRLYAPSMPVLNNRIIKGSFKDSFNYSFNVGVLYKPTDKLSIGLTYRSVAKTNFKGSVEVVGIQKVDATTHIDHPDQIQVGIRYKPVNNVSVEADVTWTHWHLIKGYTLHFDSPLLGKTSETFKRSWKNTEKIRFGVEWKTSKLLTLRAGYYYDPSPIPDSTFDMLWPDGDKKTYSVGAGLNFGRLTLDLAFQYTVAEHKRVIGGESTELNNSYSDPLTGQPGSVSVKAGGYLLGYALTLTYKF